MFHESPSPQTLGAPSTKNIKVSIARFWENNAVWLWVIEDFAWAAVAVAYRRRIWSIRVG